MVESMLSKSQSRQDRSDAGIVRGNIQRLQQENYQSFRLRDVVPFQAVAVRTDKSQKPTPLLFSEYKLCNEYPCFIFQD